MLEYLAFMRDNASENNPLGNTAMNLPYFDDSDVKVKEALKIWADCLKVHDFRELGYSEPNIYYLKTGYSSDEDEETSVNNNIAVNVQAVYDGLSKVQKLSIDHFHLSAVWHPNRYNILDIYATAILAMKRGLRSRLII